MELKKIIEKEKNTVIELNEYICSAEGIMPLQVRFNSHVNKQAYITHKGSKPLFITINMNNICTGAAYVLCHEIAHQIELLTKGKTDHKSGFKSIESRLVKKYATCDIARRLVF